MEVFFQNHASLVIKENGSYLLTDPWFQKPAFGSWLPTFAPYIHPSYLAGLHDKLSILISHGHDDHCDDELLTCFDLETEIIVANFSSPSVINRLKKIGFKNIKIADRTGIKSQNGFYIKSYISPARSLDDAIFSIKGTDGLVLHCNDNWFELETSVREGLTQDIQQFDEKNVLLLSQTNSASGFPLNYSCFPESEKKKMLINKVKGMILQGMRNAKALGLKKMASYAGFASVFIKEKPEYLTQGLCPTERSILAEIVSQNDILEADVSEIKILDYFPGDTFQCCDGSIQKAFLNSHDYSDKNIKESTQLFYKNYHIIEQCDTYLTHDEYNPNTFSEKINYFLNQFNEFVVSKCKRDGSMYDTIIGKTFEIEFPDLQSQYKIEFGKGSIQNHEKKSNKKLVINSHTFSLVLDGKILFENLYTGYAGTWERFPTHIYNRDIILFIVMFSYVYKNRLAASRPE